MASDDLIYHHKQRIDDGIHIAHSFEYADAVARYAVTENDISAEDVNKLALQLDNNSLWILTNHNPVTWQLVSMLASDKAKLDGIEPQAAPNQNAFSNIIVNDGSVAATATTDTLTLVGGSNISLAADSENKTITIDVSGSGFVPSPHKNSHLPDVVGATDAIPYATEAQAGLMPKTAVAKLNQLKTLVAGANITLTPEGEQLRITASSGSGGTVTPVLSHGALLDLTVGDDHPQYLKKTEHTSSQHAFMPIGPVPHDSLAQLTDVALTALSPGHTLVYSNNAKWVNQPAGTSQSAALSGLLDVALTAPSNQQALVYNASLAKWTNAALSATPTTHSNSHLTGGTDAIAVATTTTNGLMPSAAVTKLNQLSPLIAGTNVTLVQQGSNLVINASVTGGTGLVSHANTHLTGGVDAIPVATTTQDGLMSKTDKEAFETMRTGDYIPRTSSVNISAQHTFNNAFLSVRDSNNAGYAGFFQGFNNGAAVFVEQDSFGNGIQANVKTKGNTCFFGLIPSDNTNINSYCFAGENNSATGGVASFINKGDKYAVTISSENSATSGGLYIESKTRCIGAYLTDTAGAHGVFAQIPEGNVSTEPTASAICGINRSVGGCAGFFGSIHPNNNGSTVNIRNSGAGWCMTAVTGLNTGNDESNFSEAEGLYLRTKKAKNAIRVNRGQISLDEGAFNVTTTLANTMPVQVNVVGTANPGAAIAVYSDSETLLSGERRWGIYVRHAADGAAIAAVPTKTSYAGLHCRIDQAGSSPCNGILVSDDRVQNAANCIHVASVGQGSGLRISKDNTSAGDVIMVTTNGSGRAMYLSHTGTGQCARFDQVSTTNAASAVYMQNNGTGYCLETSTNAGQGIRVTVPTGKYAGYFTGNMHVTGSMSKGSGTFMIDHPLDPLNKTLSHSFVESPEMLNIYNDHITLDDNGEATVELPSYFEALNHKFRYQLTAVGQPMPQLFVKSKINNGVFVIGGGAPGGEVEWQIMGVRRDKFALANPVQVEATKATPAYLHPELYQ